MHNDYLKIYLYKRIIHAKLFIDNQYSEHIDLNNIANEANFSKFHFIRLFKNIYGKTPHQYLRSVRLENAKRLLERGSSVSEACFGVGFDSITSFTGIFKQYTRTSPFEYQRLYKQRQEQIRKIPLQFIPACFATQKGWPEKSNFEEAL